MGMLLRIPPALIVAGPNVTLSQNLRSLLDNIYADHDALGVLNLL